MDSLNPESSPFLVAPAAQRPRVWKFWGTALWGFVVFVAMFAGQIAVVVIFVLQRGGSVELGSVIQVVAASGLAISLSVIAGLPAVLAALWLAIRLTPTPFADYLALRWTNWRNVLIGIVGLAILVFGWDMLSRATGREVTADFMVEVLKSARSDGALWLLVAAFCVAAPISEELFARGFLYRGWSESFLKVPGAIVLSSLVWTGLHLQYDWFFFGEVFCIGLWLGYIRYRSNSTWLTIVIHGLNNLGAVLQTIWLAGSR
jgi:membrane protease YdiL (CAAX protease family)